MGGGGPDGAPRPATAADGGDPLAETGIGVGGPFGPPEASEGSPRGECVLDSSESLGATTWVVFLLLRTGGGVRDVARSLCFEMEPTWLETIALADTGLESLKSGRKRSKRSSLTDLHPGSRLRQYDLELTESAH